MNLGSSLTFRKKTRQGLANGRRGRSGVAPHQTPAIHLAREQVCVLARAGADLALRTLGLLNFKPLFERPGRKTIAFQSYSAHLARCYAPVIARLRESSSDVRIVFLILRHPHVPLSATRELRRYVRDGLAIEDDDVLFFWQSLWARFDMLVCGDVFARFPVRRTSTVLMPHGTGLAPRWLNQHPLRKSFADFDHLLLAGEYDFDVLSQHPTAGALAVRARPIGFPFIDAIPNFPLTREQYDGRLRLAPKRPIVLFAPHHFALRTAASIGYVRDMVEALKPLDADLVLKFHAISFYPAMAGGNRWRAVLSDLARDPRVHIDEEEEDLAALRYADVLVTDYSSRAFIFMALHKPVVLVTPSSPNMMQESLDRMDLMRRGSLLARSPSEAVRLVSRMLSDPAPPPNAGKIAERCFSNLWNATDPVVEFLTRELSRHSMPAGHRSARPSGEEQKAS